MLGGSQSCSFVWIQTRYLELPVYGLHYELSLAACTQGQIWDKIPLVMFVWGHVQAASGIIIIICVLFKFEFENISETSKLHLSLQIYNSSGALYQLTTTAWSSVQTGLFTFVSCCLLSMSICSGSCDREENVCLEEFWKCSGWLSSSF